MSFNCYRSQLEARQFSSGWTVEKVSPYAGGGARLELSNGQSTTSLIIQPGNADLGAYLHAHGARLFFDKEPDGGIDESLHAAVEQIAESSESCLKAEISAAGKNADAPTLGGFYLPMILLAVFLVGALSFFWNARKQKAAEAAKQALLNILLLSASLAIALLLAEGAARLFGGDPSRPRELAQQDGLYHLLPTRQQEMRLMENEWHVEKNSSGEWLWLPSDITLTNTKRRGFPPKRLPGGTGFSILAVGDSILFGSGVEEENTFLALAERRFRQEHPDLKTDFVKLAQPGWNLAQYKLAIEAWVPELKPDLILIAFWKNDIVNVAYSGEYAVRADVSLA